MIFPSIFLANCYFCRSADLLEQQNNTQRTVQINDSQSGQLNSPEQSGSGCGPLRRLVPRDSITVVNGVVSCSHPGEWTRRMRFPNEVPIFDKGMEWVGSTDESGGSSGESTDSTSESDSDDESSSSYDVPL